MNEYIKNPKTIFIPLAARDIFRWMTDEKFLKLSYFVRGKDKLDFTNPKRFNDKLQWLKVYDHNPLYTKLVDKCEVKGIVAEVIGNRYVIPTLSVYNSVEDIDFDVLPKQFVLKCTHGSKCNVICKDKDKLDIPLTKKRLSKWMKMNWFDYGREWPYKNVEHRIIAEKYMEDETGELRDYKVMCFEGIPRLIQIHIGRFGDKHTQDFYDTDWNKLDITQGSDMSDKTIPKIPCLDEMLELSRKLSKGIHQIRVDWYYIHGELFFGEMTFFDTSGYEEFEPDFWNYRLGEWINIP